MMKISLPLLVLCSSLSYSQVGINNTDPKATLDITAKTTDASKPEGLIAPRLTGDQIRNKNAQYDTAQIGAIIYATTADSFPTGKTVNITAPGYYYFDGIAWQKINTGVGGSNVVGSGNNIYTIDGTLQDNRTVTMADKTLNFNSTATTGTSHFNVDGSTLNVDAVNNRVGIGTSTPKFFLDVVGDNSAYGHAIGISNSALNPQDRAAIGVQGSGTIQRWLQFIAPGTASSAFAFKFDTPNGQALTVMSNGQVGMSNPSPDPSAQLDVRSSDKGFLPPRLALSATNNKSPLTTASPNPGVLVYNTATTTNKPYDVSPGYYYWNGSNWMRLATGTGASNSSNWAVGEERVFMYSATDATWNTTGTTKTYMTGKAVNNTSTTSGKLLSEAMMQESGDISNALVINGMRLDFLRQNPRFVNTTASPITYSLVSLSTVNPYVNGTKTIIAPNAICYYVDGDNNFYYSNNNEGELDNGFIVFPTGEWYDFSVYLIQIDGVAQGYTRAKRLR
ncbi:hypothetical protein [Chryseobacterium ginsengisoli]